MYKVYESFNLSHVGQLQSVLESNGIRTFLKNQFASSVMGEIPFVEICPQLFVLREQDIGKAKSLLQLSDEHEESSPAWVCPKCHSEVDGPFEVCWNCQTERPA